MRRKIIVLTALILLAAGGLYAWRHHAHSVARAAMPAPVEVVVGDVESVVTAQGKLEPKDYVDVGAQVSGMVTTLQAEVGDDVKQGELIAEIDPDVYQSEVKADEARLKTLQAQEEEQQALVRQAQQKLDRNTALIKAHAISTEVMEDAQTAFDVANAQLKSLQAQIEEAQSTLDGARANLNYTKIYSPMTGTVVSQSVKVGQTINANQTAPVIVQVANLDVMTAMAQVAEADITKLKVGMPVYFTTLGSQGRRWEGTVRQLLPTPETVNDVVLYDVLADFDNKDHQLMTGMTTQMFFVLGSQKQVPVVPVSVLGRRLPDQDNDKGLAYEVHIAGKDGGARVVHVSLSDRSRAAIADGLAAGERIRPAAATAAPAGDAAKPAAAPRRMGMGRL